MKVAWIVESVLAGEFVLRSFNDCDVPLALQKATDELQVFQMILDYGSICLLTARTFNSCCQVFSCLYCGSTNRAALLGRLLLVTES